MLHCQSVLSHDAVDMRPSATRRHMSDHLRMAFVHGELLLALDAPVGLLHRRAVLSPDAVNMQPSATCMHAIVFPWPSYLVLSW